MVKELSDAEYFMQIDEENWLVNQLSVLEGDEFKVALLSYLKALKGLRNKKDKTVMRRVIASAVQEKTDKFYFKLVDITHPDLDKNLNRYVSKWIKLLEGDLNVK